MQHGGPDGRGRDMRLIDADAFKEWLMENSINERERDESREIGMWIDAFPSAQPEILACGSGELVQEPDGLVKDLVKDCISRQGAIIVIENSGLDDDSKDTVLRVFEQLPSAQPEPETGTWIWKHHVWWCSECGKNPTKGMGYVQGAEELFDYCPHCGKKMEGVQM